MANDIQILVDAMTSLNDISDSGLSFLEIRNAFDTWLKTTPPESKDDLLPFDQAAVLWVATLLKKVQPALSSEQRHLVMTSWLAVQNENTADKWMLIFVDGKWFTHTGLSGFTCLTTGRLVETLVTPPVMLVSYNLSEFIRRQIEGTGNAQQTTDG